MNSELLRGYFQELERDGWQPPQRQDDVWQTSCEENVVKVKVSSNWVYVQTPVDNPSQPCPIGFYLNSRLLMTKLCHLTDGHMLLSTEWPAANLNFTTLKLALTAVVQALQFLDNPESWLSHEQPETPPASEMALYIPPERIWQYVRQIDMYGWSLRGEPEDTRWRFGYLGHTLRYDVYMHFTANWTHFQAPLGERIPDLSQRNVLCRYLLQLNQRMMMAKFRLTKQGRIALTIQCPTEQLNFSMFEMCMQGIATYLDRYASEVILLATSARLGRFVQSGQLPQLNDLGIEPIPEDDITEETAPTA